MKCYKTVAPFLKSFSFSLKMFKATPTANCKETRANACVPLSYNHAPLILGVQGLCGEKKVAK